tara:strand:- start:65681 stop:66025 length:345 start_codon:yes stop_codon:yes gene_type:complete
MSEKICCLECGREFGTWNSSKTQGVCLDCDTKGLYKATVVSCEALEVAVPEPSEKVKEVLIAGIKIPFWSLVMLLVKLAIASIPAFMILFIIGALAIGLFGSLFGGIFVNMSRY